MHLSFKIQYLVPNYIQDSFIMWNIIEAFSFSSARKSWRDGFGILQLFGIRLPHHWHHLESYSNISFHETAPSEHPMTTYNFVYTTRKKRVKRLSQLRQKGFFKNRKSGTFKLETVQNWNGDESKLFLELFSYFHEKGIIWKELKIGVSTYNERFTRPLLHAVNTMKICKTMSLEFHAEHGDSDVYSDLCPGFASNTSIQELSITTTGRPSRGDFVALNNLLQTNAPCLQTLVIRAPGESYRWILSGLRDNRTLKTIDFNFPMNTTDATMSAIVAAMARNPNLESLKTDFGKKCYFLFRKKILLV